MQDIIDALKSATVQAMQSTLLSRDDLQHLVRHQLHGRWKPVAQRFVFIGDMMYVCPDRKELDRLIAGFKPTAPKYSTVMEDCDDFAWLFKAYACTEGSARQKPAPYAIGVIWHTSRDQARTGHAYNWVVTDKHEVLIIEPQGGPPRKLNKTDINIDLVCC